MLKASIPWLLVVPEGHTHHDWVAGLLAPEFGWSHGVEHPDLHWLNPDEKPLTIDQVRLLQTEITYQPYSETKQFFVIHHLNLSSVPAQNALLKTFEEPPETVQILITVNQIDGVLPTIQSRCLIKTLTATVPVSLESQQVNDEAAALFNRLKTATPNQIIELGEGYTDKQNALATLYALIRFATLKLETQPTPHLHRQLIHLTEAVERLQHNTNVRLTMEVCFLQLVPAK